MASQKILIVQTAFVGDAVLTIPLIVNTQKQYPEAEISLLCRKGLGSLFKDLKLVDEVFEFDKSNKSTWKKIEKELKRQKFELIICPHESFRSQLLVSQLKAKTKVGYKKWWNFWVFDKRVERPMQYPEVVRQAVLLTMVSEPYKSQWEAEVPLKELESPETKKDIQFGGSTSIPELLSLKLDLGSCFSEEIIQKGKALLAEKGIEPNETFVSISPGSVWETKKWPLEKYIHLVKSLRAKGEKVILFGSPAEAELCESVQATHPNGVYNLAGRTSLTEMTYLFTLSKLLFCNDSGSMHIAALAGLPTISFFGPTVLSLGYRPWNNKSIVLQNPLSCRPCGLHGAKKCPIGTHECMRKLEVDRAIEAFEKLNS